MSKENLRKGLESWIRDTRQVVPEVETWPVAGCKLRRIGTAEIRVGEPRIAVHGQADLGELKASLEKEGQRFPVRVRVKDGGFELVSGFRRLQACRELGRDSLLAIVHEEISDDEAERLYLMENFCGGDVEGLAVAELIAARGEDTLREMMVPDQLLERYRPLAEAPAVRAALAARRLTLDQAMALVATGDGDALVEEAAGGGLAAEAIVELGRRRSLERAAAEGRAEDLDAWAGRIRGELAALAERLDTLHAARERLAAPARDALATALERFEQAQRRWRPEPAETHTELAPTERAPVAPAAPPVEWYPAGRPPSGEVTPVSPERFETEILGSESFVLLHLHLPGHPASEQAEAALRGVAAAYEGRVELRSMDLMTAPLDDELPRMVKIGRDFLLKNLPCVLLYKNGRKIGGREGELGTEDLVELLHSRV